MDIGFIPKWVHGMPMVYRHTSLSKLHGPLTACGMPTDKNDLHPRGPLCWAKSPTPPNFVFLVRTHLGLS